MSVAAPVLDSLYAARAGTVDFVDVPELAYLSVTGQGAREGEEFAAAVQALSSVSSAAQALVEHQQGSAPEVRPLEALWWTDDPRRMRLLVDVAKGAGAIGSGDRSGWRWQAMIRQPDEVDARVVARALHPARAPRIPSLDAVRFLHWTEGRCAQTLHVGPYAGEGPTIARLHAAIAEAGYRPRGRHHEIYLGDPRHTAPDRMTTLLRQPVGPA